MHATGNINENHLNQCALAINCLLIEGERMLGRANLRLNLREKKANNLIHFDFPPVDAENDELHRGAAILLAAISMVTGWVMDPQVSAIVPDVWSLRPFGFRPGPSPPSACIPPAPTVF